MAMFKLGSVVATPGAIQTMAEAGDPMVSSKLLARHMSGDWGDLDSEDKQANDAAVMEGSRIFSAYKLASGKVWLITEADRSSTTFLLPEEY